MPLPRGGCSTEKLVVWHHFFFSAACSSGSQAIFFGGGWTHTHTPEMDLGGGMFRYLIPHPSQIDTDSDD